MEEEFGPVVQHQRDPQRIAIAGLAVMRREPVYCIQCLPVSEIHGPVAIGPGCLQRDVQERIATCSRGSIRKYLVDAVHSLFLSLVHLTAVTSISTCASSSISAVTSTTLIAGKCLPMTSRYTGPSSARRLT